MKRDPSFFAGLVVLIATAKHNVAIRHFAVSSIPQRGSAVPMFEWWWSDYISMRDFVPGSTSPSLRPSLFLGCATFSKKRRKCDTLNPHNVVIRANTPKSILKHHLTCHFESFYEKKVLGLLTL